MQCFDTMRDENRKDYIRQQESVISQQSKYLLKSGNSYFELNFIKARPTLFQAHCERIADFVFPGENTWWSLCNGGVMFHDGPDDQSLKYILLSFTFDQRRPRCRNNVCMMTGEYAYGTVKHQTSVFPSTKSRYMRKDV